VIDVALLGIIRRWHLRDQVPLREIAKRLGISRNTVRRYLRSEITEPAYAERQSASAIDPYAFQLSGWLKTEAAKSRKQRRSLKQLHEELVDLGFKGSYDRVAAFARQWREGQTEWVNSARNRTFRLLAYAMTNVSMLGLGDLNRLHRVGCRYSENACTVCKLSI
jgi:transcriptional regulator with XRE-family HTH domain